MPDTDITQNDTFNPTGLPVKFCYIDTWENFKKIPTNNQKDKYTLFFIGDKKVIWLGNSGQFTYNGNVTIANSLSMFNSWSEISRDGDIIYYLDINEDTGQKTMQIKFGDGKHHWKDIPAIGNVNIKPVDDLTIFDSNTEYSNLGEIIYYLDINEDTGKSVVKFKIGDGEHHWSDIPLITNDNQEIIDSVDSINKNISTLNNSLVQHSKDTAIHVTKDWKDNVDNHVKDTNVHITKEWKTNIDNHINNTEVHVTKVWKNDMDSNRLAFQNHINNTDEHVTASFKTDVINHIADDDMHLTSIQANEIAEAYRHTSRTDIHVTAEEKAKWNAIAESGGTGGSGGSGGGQNTLFYVDESDSDGAKLVISYI